MRKRWGLTPAILFSLTLAWPHTAFAHPDSGQEFSELFGSFAWGLYLIVPVPFLVMGVIGFLLYRAGRNRNTASAPRSISPADPRPN